MSIRSVRHTAGFTLVELVVILSVSGIVATTFFVFFNSTLTQYLSLQKDGSDFSDLATQSQRIAAVLRGLTDITAQSADDITCYAYFSPSDAYVSLIHYYKNPAGTQLLADVTPLDANPPTGALIASKKQTFVIIPNFYKSPNLDTFTYLDDVGTALPQPIADQHSIKGIQINLAVQGAHNSDQAVTVQVSLRNRKTNL